MYFLFIIKFGILIKNKPTACKNQVVDTGLVRQRRIQENEFVKPISEYRHLHLYPPGVITLLLLWTQILTNK